MLTALTAKSTNVKTGPIPVSTSSAATCPDACPFKAGGCYANGGPLALHWRKVTEGVRGTDWGTFVAKVREMAAGTFWRHNQAGDLPGVNGAIDGVALADLVYANAGRRGFTYTHKPVQGSSPVAQANREAVAHANANGFTINLSANSPRDVDALVALGIGPVAVVLDVNEGENVSITTDAGNKIITCPATYRDDVTCASCQLCQRQRSVVVGFPAHGASKKKARAVAAG